ncbi:ABC transporter ATP-binding protein [Arthrobacter sp. NPDC089319]|uniref:branched-chain amino acid ABC transporter ATP-binding protein n=1 Tax=Arthrobacter sp. NPDC089319 TaxID=3155915 RepID=UPI003421F9D3
MSQVKEAPVVLDVRNFSTGYRGNPVIRDVSLQSRGGQLTCIVGPNGCGKSTLLKGLAGVLAPMGGSISLHGEDVTGKKTPELALSGVGYVPQLKDVFGPLTVQENLELGGYALSRSKTSERIDAVVEMFPRLKEMLTRHAGNLSGGERKMLAVARVLMLEPKLLLLDEPTAGLTEELAHRMLEEQLSGVMRAGVAVVLVEQRANIALHASDYAYLLTSGQVRREGPSSELLADPTFAEVFLGGEGATGIRATSWSKQ